ncbi:MAG: ATP-binding protein [Verrucomicrobia subdivision 3 bacterium]|nr:ATP-binding protein [Limisphaerales bacterium]
MKGFQWLGKLRELFEETAPSPGEMAFRLQSVERDIILPVKAAFIGVLLYNFYFTRWFEELYVPWSVAQYIVERFFLIYLTVNAVVAGILVFSGRFPATLVQWAIFTTNFIDGLFVAALTFVTGGFDSILYWVFLGLIIRNAVSCPLAAPQIILNFSLSFCYILAGMLDVILTAEMVEYEQAPRSSDNLTEPFLLRLIVLWLMTACCYGVQVLFERHRQAAEEAREFGARQEQLRAAGRLAAQIAHQIKNPLAIINNAAYSLEKSLREGKNSNLQQVEIIREEVERSDRIITKLMGYAQLAEGKVEKLQVTDEVERAIGQVFPPGAPYEVALERDYSLHLPPLLMQRGHLSEILVNILQNAREATGGEGRITIEARHGPDGSVMVTIADDGPGIPAERFEKVFQPYFSTKEKGSGLGLAIAKHNAEMYGGAIKVESELGKGTRFILHLPTRTFMKLQS